MNIPACLCETGLVILVLGSTKGSRPHSILHKGTPPPPKNAKSSNGRHLATMNFDEILDAHNWHELYYIFRNARATIKKGNGLTEMGIGNSVWRHRR